MYYLRLSLDVPKKPKRLYISGYRLYECTLSRRTVATNVELAFSERSLRQLCESKVTADRKLGAKVGERLRRRIADLHAAVSVKDLVTGQPREVEHDHYLVQVFDDCSISFCANHHTLPRLTSGKTDWSKVSRIKIVRIGAYVDHR
jgi:hypothetical protein